MSFGEKLKVARKNANMSQEALAKELGVNRVAISNYEQNKNEPTFANVRKIIKILKLPNDYFGAQEKESIKTIPLIGLASCGIPQEYDMNGYEPVPVSNELYKDGMYAVRAEGDSMSPKINDGNLVYCVANEHIENGNIVHYTINGESGIKKYKINEKGDIISLVPLNSEYDIITIHADDNISFQMAKVVGVVDTDF